MSFLCRFSVLSLSPFFLLSCLLSLRRVLRQAEKHLLPFFQHLFSTINLRAANDLRQKHDRVSTLCGCLRDKN